MARMPQQSEFYRAVADAVEKVLRSGGPSQTAAITIANVALNRAQRAVAIASRQAGLTGAASMGFAVPNAVSAVDFAVQLAFTAEQKRKFASEVNASLSSQAQALVASQRLRQDYSSQDINRYVSTMSDAGPFRQAMRDRVNATAEMVPSWLPGSNFVRSIVAADEEERQANQQMKLKRMADFRLRNQGRMSERDLSNVQAGGFMNLPEVKLSTTFRRLMERFGAGADAGMVANLSALGQTSWVKAKQFFGYPAELEIQQEVAGERSAASMKAAEKKIADEHEQWWNLSTAAPTNRSIYQEKERQFRAVEEDRIRSFYQWNPY